MNSATPLPNGPRDWTEDFKGDNGCYQHLCGTCFNRFFGAKYRRFIRICKVCDNRQRIYGTEAIAELENDNAALVAAGMEIPNEDYREAFVRGYVIASMRAQARSLDPSIVPEEMTTADLARIICEKHPTNK